jgi:hypothetical protein
MTEGPRLCGRGTGGRRCNILQAATAALQHLHQGSTGVLQEMETVSDLDGPWRSHPYAFNIGFGAVPHHHFHSRMGLEPGG